MIWQPHNVQVGAGTMNPATALQVLGPEPWNVAYVEPSIRPADSRYGENPNRMQRFYQYQVILKPEPGNPQELYLESLEALGIDRSKHDVRFVEDNWESPALGAWGLGWEVWLDGQEITQYTYFQQAGGFPTDPVSVELTYGLERIAMPLQGVRSFRDIEWAPGITYADVLLQAEIEHSRYNLDHADVDELRELFDIYERQGNRLIEMGLVLPAYDFVLNCSHTFNVLDSRGAVGVTERAHFFTRMRNLSRNISRAFVEQRESLGFPRSKQWVIGAVASEEASEPPALPAPDRPRPLLLEIGVEELPAQDVTDALDQLEANARRLLADARLSHGALQVVGTPRRLALLVDDVSPCQPDEEEERKGPPAKAAFDADGNPTKAAQGFARSAGVSVESLELRQEGNREYVVAHVRQEGQSAGVILAALLSELVASISFGKSMRWNGDGVSFSRPLRWFVALLGNDVIPFEYAGLRAGRTSRGLRSYRSPEVIVAGADAYLAAMGENQIMIRVDARRAAIQQQAEGLAAEVKGRIPADDDLLMEVANLNECPVAIRGDFEEAFLELPEDVLIAVMKKHQRYFPVVDAETGKMLPHFIVIANGDNLDVDRVRAGNEEVLWARFADAAFFFEADSKKKLEEFLPRLDTLMFQQKLGTMRDKSQRLEKLAPAISRHLGLSADEQATLERATHLSKADLATQMVVEMTSLQGIMGREYALLGGEASAVAGAIAEQYLPKGAGGRLPASRPGMALALADRVDSLVGLIAIGMKPTGSADPFGLRRAALGIVQILTGHQVSLSLRKLFREAGETLPVPCTDEALAEALEFLVGRLRVWVSEQGLRHDVIEAALAECGHDPYRALQMAQELSPWLEREDWPAILAAYSRCVRIVRSQEQTFTLDPARFVEPATGALHDAYLACKAAIPAGGGVDDFLNAFLAMIAPINRFFDDVLVMAEDEAVRQNRLALLQHIAALTAGIADFSKLEGF